ncbi:hypothetical protein [Methylobacterium sp. ARG-1]|uniref:hypothetical protein n=1 Tax=Methylobacterium sp. ARG-1 TaxID=1692501 RepID=UPI000681F3C5|nr:hypothetical protein [Methylobacterium sp. ARG-1]KNY20368.1 hypothetical protein AKJ13_22310 [Methylobacterium sp. ARG-1]
MQGLSLFRLTSDRRTVNLASWHSPHSLTWRWILSAGFQRIVFAKPRGMWKTTGPHVYRCGSIGTVLSAFAMRHNNGWQFGLTVLGLAISFSQQRPMWFRDLYYAEQNRRYERRAA